VVEKPGFRIQLDHDSFLPYYAQIAAQVRQAINANNLHPGELFWSEGELARQLGISKAPIKRAFERLRSEGLLVISQGRHPVVGAAGVRWDTQHLWGFAEEIRQQGLRPSTRLLSVRIVSADAETSAALGLPPAAHVYRVQRLRFIEQDPVAVETTHLPAALFPQLETRDLGLQSLYFVIENTYGRKLERCDECIGAVSAGAEEASYLKVRVGSPLVKAQRLVHDVHGAAVEFGFSLFRADRFVARVVSFRGSGPAPSTQPRLELRDPSVRVDGNEAPGPLERGS